MASRCAAGPGRAVLRSATSRSAPLRGSSEAPLAWHGLQQLRGFARGPNFQGFPFGGGAGGPPPRGDSEKFYRLLGIERGADDAAIKRAYKQQAMKHHPDRGGDEAQFKEISRAYEVLSNPEKRQIYDQFGESGLEGMEQGGSAGGPQGEMDPFDLFSQIFGFNAGGGRRTHRGRPVTPDSRYELELTLEELYAGASRSIVFTREALCKPCKGVGGFNEQRCGTCDGTGRVIMMQQMGLFVQQMETVCTACGGKGYKIPPKDICKACNGKGTSKEKKTFSIDVEPGAQDGTEFRFRGQADEAPGHDTGDVVINVKEKSHKVFKRLRENLVMKKTVSLAEALCGFQISTPFLNGEDLVIRSEPEQVVKPGDIMIIKGKGMPRQKGQKPGDLFVVFDVEFPAKLGADEQRRLSDAMGAEPMAEAPPLAEVGQKLSAQQATELKYRWAQVAQEAREARSQPQNCAQQ